MKRSPAASNARCQGLLIPACVAGPPSPVLFGWPLPAIGGDDAGRSDLTNAIRVGLGDIDVPGRIHRDAERTREADVGSRSSVAGELTSARDRVDEAVGDLPDEVALTIDLGDVDVSRGIEGQGVGKRQVSVDGHSTISEIAALSAAREGGNDALGIHHAYAGVSDRRCRRCRDCRRRRRRLREVIVRLVLLGHSRRYSILRPRRWISCRRE